MNAASPDARLYADVPERLRQVQARMERARQKSGSPVAPRLIAVSKGHPVRAIEAAYAAGQRDFGENYAQQLASKAATLAHLADLRWHMIGHLQRNKVRLVVPHIGCLHTVDSEQLVLELNKRLRARTTTGLGGSGSALDVLIEVNIAGEPNKSGVSPNKLQELIRACASCPLIKLVGLMTVPPLCESLEQTRGYFAELRRLRDQHGGVSRLPELSMGMSADFEQAVTAGATLVRIGTTIFGPRPATNAASV